MRESEASAAAIFCAKAKRQPQHGSVPVATLSVQKTFVTTVSLTLHKTFAERS
ncbi:hypothetical protein ACQKNB_23990 [Lysinibacillus xylanilyticus]|uniref:hypothetical protein n=1 Tax=Lysinibacillus xylanilyticus TaxID=582475 RepID=UPI003D003DBB